MARQNAERFGPVTFKSAAQLYIDYRDPRKQDRTFIAKLVAVIGDKLLTEITSHVLIAAANTIYAKREASTKNRNALVPAAAIIHYAAENNLCRHLRVRKFKEKSPEPRSVSKDIGRVLIANSEGDMRRALVWLFCQGWRISDMLRVQRQHIDRSAGTVRYRISKTDKWREKPLHSDVLAILPDDGKQIGPLFPWSDRFAFYRDLTPLCAKLKIRFTPHMARHSFATWRVNDGASLQEIMEAGGWKSIKSVMRYADLDAARVRSAVDRVKL
ncbi:MAG TPA: tyrosine-type recombinase/integrase [Anaerolineae bacterium]